MRIAAIGILISVYFAAATSTVAAQTNSPSGNEASDESPLFNVLHFGAVADGITNNTSAFASANEACRERGGGTIHVPPGVYLTGPIELGDHMTLHLEAGAKILASLRLEDYPVEPKTGWGDGSGESIRAGLITARDARHVTITGRGVIDGNAMAFHDPNTLHGRIDKRFTRQGDSYMDPKFGTEHGPIAHGERPGNLIRFFGCVDVHLESLTIQNSPTWTVQFNGCENIDVRGVDINSLASGRRIPNDDGIDIFNCKNIHISDCDIQTGDDCIAIFAGEKLTVSNCTLSSRSSGIRVGYVGGDIRDCVYKNLVIHSNRGISLFVRGEDSIENILFSDIVIRSHLVTGHWWGQAEPIHVSVAQWDQNAESLGSISNVRFSNILAEGHAGVVVHGDKTSPIRDLSFENVRLKLTDGPLQSSYGGNFDLRAAKRPEQGVFKHDIPAVYCRHAEGLRINGLQVAWSETVPDFFSHAMQLEDSRDIVIDGFEGHQAQDSGSAIFLNRVEGISVRNSVASKGTDTFLFAREVDDARLFVGNDLSDAHRATSPDDLGFTRGENRLPQR